MSTSDAAEEPGRSTAADLAASALLGALLWDPRRLHDVGWLQPEDFRHWADRAVYQTLVGMLADGRPVDLRTFPEVLARAEYHDAHVDGTGIGPLSGSAVHTLISMTPATPAGDAENYEGPVRSEHVRYGRLVLDDSIRRHVEAAGTRIDQYARYISGQDSARAAEGLTPVLAEVEARLRELTDRLGSTGSSMRSAIAAAMGPTALEDPIPGPALTDELGASPTRVALTPEQLRRAEYTLVGACVVSSQMRQVVGDRVLAEDFTAPEAAATWQAIRGLQRRGEPVDFVLVAAEVERQGELPEFGRGLDPDELFRLRQRFDLVPAYQALETVVHAALARAVHQAGDQLQDLGTDRAQSSENALRSAQEAIGEVGRTARRLTGSAARTALAAFSPPADQAPATRRPRPPVHAPDPVSIPTARGPQRRR